MQSNTVFSAYVRPEDKAAFMEICRTEKEKDSRKTNGDIFHALIDAYRKAKGDK